MANINERKISIRFRDQAQVAYIKRAATKTGLSFNRFVHLCAENMARTLLTTGKGEIFINAQSIARASARALPKHSQPGA
jgi:uncharacterized protein (DUF1778 family)